MSVYNSPINSDHDPDPVIRISKLDINDPLHLHPNDTNALTALEGKNKIGFIDGSCKRSNTNEVFGKQWDRANAIVLGWILNSISEELFLGFKKHNQLLKLMQFLMGLDDSYMQIRSSILSKEVLPNMRSTYATNSSEESHRVLVGSIAGSSQRNQASCVSNNNSVGKSSSSGFTDEQMATLVSLIKYNKVGKNVQINMTGANHHMTYTDKELDNVLDISHLKIKVSHPNGTEAYISKIGNLRLSNGLTLYDMMVIPEYYVTLIFVHKLVNENKVIVAFDENRCHFLNQDLNLKNVLGLHDWHCRLGHRADPVLNVLKDSLNIDKKDNTICCEIYQKAKQTRKPFLLSDHTSNRLGDLVHLDLWGPYKISNDDERVANDLNKDKSDISSSSVSGSNINTADFPVYYENDGDSSDDLVATHNEKVATLEENVFSEEMDALLRNGTWELVGLPEGRKANGSKWVYKIKFRSSGEIDRYKARLVAQGFRQKEGINYEETFSPVVKMVIVRCLLNVVVSMSCLVFQLDVNNTFLYGDLEEKPPEGYFPSDNKVCRLKKSLYGLKQAPRQWNAKLTSTLIENGFSQSKSDYSLYTKSDKVVFLALLGYVDDIIITDTNKGIYLNKRKYVLDLLSKCGILACKPAKTPLMSKLVISNEASKNDPLLENIIDYQKLMGKLIYLTNTRPDISYVVHCLSQFMHSPLSSHLKTAFKILRYLKSYPVLGIHIARTSGMFLNAYSDADWANNKQNTLSKSSTEAEYRGLASVTSEVIWILKILKDFQIEKLLPLFLHCDYNSTIKIAANLIFTERTKHLEIDLHFVKEKILEGVVKTVKVDSANQIADILTKGLDTVQHLELVKRLGMIDVYQVETKGGS
ncbi:ribonuclease H-like domain-containing protein [Tanacetum coccineum]